MLKILKTLFTMQNVEEIKQNNLIIFSNLLRSNKLNGNRNHLIATCPYCGKEKHFYINVFSGSWDCKKCGMCGSKNDFFYKFNRLDLVEKNFADVFKPLKNFSFDKKYDITDDPYFMKFELKHRRKVIGFTRIQNDEYLNSRNFIKRNYDENVIGETELKSDFEDYVIFNVYQNNDLKGYIGRNKKDEKNKLRYLKSNSEFGKMLYGYDEITPKTKTIILTEGIFDKIALDNYLYLQDDPKIKSLALFGKTISLEQISLLIKKNIRNIVIFLDNDAINLAKAQSYKMQTYFNKVFLTTLLKGDINTNNQNKVLEALENCYEPNEFFYKKIERKKIKLF